MIDQKRKTSTVTIHHDRCDVSTWTMNEWNILAAFVKNANLQQAAALSRLGMQLVLSEHHEPAGGTLEAMGWANDDEMPDPGVISDDITSEVIEDDMVVTPVVEIYRGPTKYAVKFGIGDGEGNFDGYEVEIKDTRAAAEDFLRSLQDEAQVAAQA